MGVCYTLGQTANSLPEAWCLTQQTSCPLICLQYPGNSAAPQDNTCDATGLSYSCICSSGLEPNASMYTQTLPYFVCTEWGNECVSNCGSDNACANSCRADHPCGARHPQPANKTSSISASSSMSSTSAPAGASVGASGTIYTGFGGAAATSSSASGSSSSGSSSSSSSAATALQFGQSSGLFVVAAGMLGGFALLL